MKIAVIYTGQVRTIEKTFKYFLNNVLLHADVHVFAVLESDNPQKYQKILNDQLYSHLKALEWLDPNDFCWINLKERLLSNMNITDHWKNYLRNSGSMIEYYQLYQAYQAMVKFEYLNDFRYDYIIRTRPDIIITKPIDFNWLNMDIVTIKECMDRIMQKTDNADCMAKENINLFMNSLLDFERIYCDDLLFKNHFGNKFNNRFDSSDIWTIDECYENLLDYVKKGKYLLSLRTNLVYIVKREFFYLIPSLGITYGLFKMTNNEYWFDAESQFQEIAIQSGLAIFDSTTNLEGNSLYYYKEENYFNNNGTLKENNCLFFICRK